MKVAELIMPSVRDRKKLRIAGTNAILSGKKMHRQNPAEYLANNDTTLICKAGNREQIAF
jgi:hypothetical protein